MYWLSLWHLEGTVHTTLLHTAWTNSCSTRCHCKQWMFVHKKYQKTNYESNISHRHSCNGGLFNSTLQLNYFSTIITENHRTHLLMLKTHTLRSMAEKTVNTQQQFCFSIDIWHFVVYGIYVVCTFRITICQSRFK